MNLRIKLLNPELPTPAYQTDGSAAIDLYASQARLLVPGGVERVPLGIAIQLPFGMVGLVCPRSGIALKHGVTLLNSPAVIDSDYRGEVHAILINHSKEDFQVTVGDRIAQLLIMPVTHVAIHVCEELNDTRRGEGGFGSTGMR